MRVPRADPDLPATATYLQPLDVVERTRPAHAEWVGAHLDAGHLILAGRQESGAGGILITGDITAGEADAMTATDPYELAGLCATTGRASTPRSAHRIFNVNVI